MRIAILDDYQRVALEMADWSAVRDRADIDVLAAHISSSAELVARLEPYDIVVAMRERTPLPASVIERLGNLELIVTTGRRNAAIDVAAARSRGVTVCGTGGLAAATVELTWALVLGLSRHLVVEDANVRAGRWQTTVGRDLHGKTLGVVGLGRIGTSVAGVGRALGMRILAWSANLTAERAQDAGATAVAMDRLLAESDVVTIHQVLSDRTRGLIGARELSLMKPDALLVNTSRGPIVETAALLFALESGSIGGAGLDVFDEEPLAADHPLRSAPRTLLTPHLGYVTEGVLRVFFGEVVEDILAYLDGAPIRELGPEAHPATSA